MFYSFILSFTPLLLCTLAAWISQKAGMLALFLEGAVIEGALFCLLFFEFTGNIYISAFFSALIPGVFSGCVAYFVVKFRGDCMLSGLALNLIFTGLAGFLVSMLYGSQGVITFPGHFYNQKLILIVLFILGIFFVLFGLYFFYRNIYGIAFRLCGRDEAFLIKEGYDIDKMKIISWFVSGFISGLAGVFLSVQLDSYVPGISSGRGWIALIIIFLGMEKISLSVLWVMLFSVLQIFLSGVSLSGNSVETGFSSLLLALPYLFCFVAFVIISVFRKLKNRNVKNKII